MNGCSKLARDGTVPFRCSRHGGGRRCPEPGCDKGGFAAEDGGEPRCSRHGGGRRCSEPGCDKSGLAAKEGGEPRWAMHPARRREAVL